MYDLKYDQDTDTRDERGYTQETHMVPIEMTFCDDCKVVKMDNINNRILLKKDNPVSYEKGIHRETTHEKQARVDD